jgi:FkbM family methyltransferase
MFSEQCARKQPQIKARGLMSFAQDCAEDLAGIQHMAQELAALDGFAEFTSPTCGLKLAVDRHFSAQMLYYFLVGDYEQSDFELISKYVRHGDVALELGGGAGLTGALLGRISGQQVAVCEPNPILADLIRRTFAVNHQSLRLIESAAVHGAYAGLTVDFHLSADYWWSSLLPSTSTRTLAVSAIKLSNLLRLSQPNVLLVDIEGYEIELFQDADLSGIETIIIEIHAPTIGAPAASKVLTNLIQAGFELVDFAAQSFVFKRGA